MRKLWKMKPVDEEKVEELSRDLNLPSLIARLLLLRGFDSAQEISTFLYPDLDSLPSPELMADLPQAVQLIRRTIARREKILLVGDYDVDGLTGTALLYWGLREMKADVACYIPHRMEEGYGLKPEIIQRAAASGARLLMTIDCGTTNFAELTLAKELGLATIVVDHHELHPNGRPPVSAFLNPLRPDCSYPTKGLASVGVAFTLWRGLAGARRQEEIWRHLDLAALGTVADVAPLKGENRVLVKRGLHQLQGTSKVGLRALLSKTGLNGECLTTEDISFKLAPRLNAMGRTGSADVALRLLITEDPQEAAALVQQMEQQNKNRGALEREALKRALAKVERQVNFSQDRVIVLEDDQWHLGVMGIVANRLAARFHRPAVVIAMSGAVCRGSARSVRDFHLVEAFEEVKEHLLEFGGHAGAAGLTIARDRVDAFRQALNGVAHRRMDRDMLTPVLDCDAVVPLTDLSDEVVRDMQALAPFGAGNPLPIFMSDDARIPADTTRRGFDPRGMRFLVEDATGRCFEALQPKQEIAEGWELDPFRGGAVRMVYSPIVRRGRTGGTIELTLRDLKRPNA